MKNNLFKLLIPIILFTLLPVCTIGETIGKTANSAPTLSGSLFINIFEPSKGSKTFIKGLSIIFPDAEIKEIYEEEIEIQQGYYENIVTPENSSYHALMNTFKSERNYLVEMKDEIDRVFSEYDMKTFNKIYNNYEIECFPHLNKVSYEERYPKNFSVDYFIPNRQLSYSLYSPSSSYVIGGEGILINVQTKEVSYPFECDIVRLYEWSPSGQYIAYTCNNSKTLVLKDIEISKTIFRIDFKNEIDDINWEPNSEHLAVLSKKNITGILPWELLLSITGHPAHYYSYYLDIISIDGTAEYKYDVIKKKKNTNVVMVWSSHDELMKIMDTEN